MVWYAAFLTLPLAPVQISQINFIRVFLALYQCIGPCHAIAPRFTQLSQRYSDVAFARVDVDQVQPVAQQYSVTAMPTFLFIKNKAVVDTVRILCTLDISFMKSSISCEWTSLLTGLCGELVEGSGSERLGESHQNPQPVV